MINPYDYITTQGNVKIKVTVGFYRSLAKQYENERELESPNETEKAGVSILCNDRVILLNDRTILTGWGDGTVPRYHPQFRSIAALVVFHSNEANELPVSTTKRNIDGTSEIFLKARKATMEGLKIFTSFTNQWKGMEDATDQFFDNSTKIEAKNAVTFAKTRGKKVIGDSKAKKFKPELPIPISKTTDARITFKRNVADIKKVSTYLFDESTISPKEVGEECFDKMLKKAK